MDKWIVAKLYKTIGVVTENMDEYNLQPATKSIFDLIDDLSKWYIRRSRERFVNGDVNALDTLRYVLVEISKLLAPFAPFLAESAYQTLVSEGEKDSVHLEDFPVKDESKLDEKLLADMDNIRKICSLGLNIRDENRIKVRQPLAQALIPVNDSELQDIVKGELNVKEVEYSKEVKEAEGFKFQSDGTVFVTLDTNISEELKAEGFLNELTRGLQVARKESGCQVGQEITVKYQTESKEIENLIDLHLEELEKVVLAKSFEKVGALENGIKLKLAEADVFVEITK